MVGGHQSGDKAVLEMLWPARRGLALHLLRVWQRLLSIDNYHQYAGPHAGRWGFANVSTYLLLHWFLVGMAGGIVWVPAAHFGFVDPCLFMALLLKP